MGTTKNSRKAFMSCIMATAMVIGFASYKAAISCSYRTAMGSVVETCGYVSDVGFMIVVNTASFITGLAIYLLYRKGIVTEGGIVQSPAIIALSIGMLVSRKEAAAALPTEALVAILGAVCGFSIVLLCIVWTRDDEAVLACHRIGALPQRGTLCMGDQLHWSRV